MLKELTPEQEQERDDLIRDYLHSITGTKTKSPSLFGQCRLSIRLENRAEYLKWKKYCAKEPAVRWDFDVQYPAIMRAIYPFKSSLDVEIIVKKIINLLQMGFNVVMSNFELKQYESQLKEDIR